MFPTNAYPIFPDVNDNTYDKMAQSSDISSDVTVKELLEKHPRLLLIFLDMGLLCVDCPAEAFHTLTEVAEEYKLDVNQLLRRINKSIRDGAWPQQLL